MIDFEVTEMTLELVPVDGSTIDGAYWWSNALRGALGSSLRFLMCRSPATRCSSCREHSECAFLKLWQPEREPLPGARGPRFRLVPWILHAEVVSNRLRVLIRLFGSAAQDAWRFKVAVELAGARGIGPLMQGFKPSGEIVAQNSTLSCLALKRAEPGEHLVARFLSPLRLVSNANPAQAPPSFASFAAAIERRLRLAQLCWSGQEPQPRQLEIEDARRVEILRSDTEWCRLTRFSRRQRRVTHLGGLKGEVTYGPGWEPFWPVIATAAVLHAGKLTTMGLGKVAFSSA
jgi:hypothetical protein